MWRELGNADMSNISLLHYSQSQLKTRFEQILQESQALREPSVSFLLKQLSMIRRFSSSNLSALLAAALEPATFVWSILTSRKTVAIKPGLLGQQHKQTGLFKHCAHAMTRARPWAMLVQRSCNINVTRIRDGWKDPTIRLFNAELKAQVPIRRH